VIHPISTSNPCLTKTTGIVGSHHFEVDPVPCPWGAFWKTSSSWKRGVGVPHPEEAMGDVIHRIQGVMPLKNKKAQM